MLRPLLIAAVLLTLAGTSSGQTEFVRGDCNGDLQTDISDAVAALAFLFSGGTVGCEDACDANDDGVVNVADGVYLLAAFFSGGDAPPAPFPDCGTDMSVDGLSCDLSPCTTSPSGNLREVAVAYLGQDSTDSGMLVTVTGSGAQHQLSSWFLAPGNGQPTLAVNAPLVDGHHPKIARLSGLASLVGNPPFVTAAIRDDGNVWVSSRQLTPSGGFIHHGTVGYGDNANVEVLSYDLAFRPVYSGFFLDEQQVVTAVVVEPTGGGPRSIRIVSWGIDAGSGTLTGLQDSGDLPISVPQSGTADEIGVSIAHSNGIQYVLTYTNSFGNLENRFFWVENDGSVVYAGGASGGQNIRGTGFVSVPQAANDVAAVTSSGFLTANRADDGSLSLSVWERRAEGFLNFEPYRIADNGLDLGPDAKGVFLPTPQLTDSWRNQAREGDRMGDAVVTGDFNGDGYDDTAIGAPYRDVNGVSNVGEVFVIHGDSSNGINNKEVTQIWSSATSGINGAPEESDRFGTALAVGDFDGDGNDDLAVGVPYESVGSTSAAGAIHIIYGSPFGLSANGDQIFTQEDFGQTSAASDLFGYALAAGDFDGDGRDDLAVSAYRREVGGHPDAGIVYIGWGTPAGLTSTGASIYHQDTVGLFDQAEDWDGFGESLAAGDFNGDGNDDLVIGVPRENVGTATDAGALHILYGNGGVGTGFTLQNFISQAGFEGGEDIGGAVEAGDLFGSAFAVGDFDDDGADDLAIGVPGESVGTDSDAGAVHILYGTIFGLLHVGNTIITQDSFNPGGGVVPSTSEPDEEFGFALAAGDSDGDGYDDLIVAAPHENLNPQCSNGSVDNAGAVFQFFGGPSGLTASGSTMHHQNACDGENANGVSAVGDQFGHAVALGDFNADGEADLVAGIPFKDRSDNEENSGAIWIAPGTPSGIDYALDEEWFVRTREVVRGRVSDMDWEDDGVGNGSLYQEGSFLDPIHVASVTKVMTLLLTVEAIEDGVVSPFDDVDVSSLAGTTGGSFLEQWDGSGPVEDMSGNEIRFIQTGDTMPLELLLHGMMMRSGNRCSVAIGEHVAQAVTGNSDNFVDMMNARAAQLGMSDSTLGHPAGGMVTTTQDLVTLMMEAWEHPLFRQISGTELYGDIAPAIQLCGSDINGFSKCNSPFTKFQTIGSYPGRLGWKGGNGRLWWNGTLPYGHPEPDAPSCTSAAVAVVERADRLITIALQQTGDRVGDSQRLLDHGFQKVFTPDRCAEREFPQTGGIVGPGGPIRVRAFDVDAIDDGAIITAVIDDFEELRLNVWLTDFAGEALLPLSNAATSYALPAGSDYAPTPLVRMSRIPTSGAAIGDYVTANLEGEHLELQIWRVGETPGGP